MATIATTATKLCSALFPKLFVIDSHHAVLATTFIIISYLEFLKVMIMVKVFTSFAVKAHHTAQKSFSTSFSFHHQLKVLSTIFTMKKLAVTILLKAKRRANITLVSSILQALCGRKRQRLVALRPKLLQTIVFTR